MNKKPTDPDSLSSEIETLWYQPESFRQTGMMQGIDLFTLAPPEQVPIVQPQIGDLIEGTLLAARLRWKNADYMVIRTDHGTLAARTDVTLGTHFATPTRVRLNAVLLESDRSAATPAWEVYSLFPLGNDVWMPASNQHLELRTKPAEGWIAEIESKLVPSFQAQLQNDRGELQELVDERARTNPLAPQIPDPTAALLLAKVMTFGSEFEKAYVDVSRPNHATDSPEYREAKATLDAFEVQARTPDNQKHLESAAAAILQEDSRLRGAIAEVQVNIMTLQDSLKEAGDLCERLRSFRQSNVTMELSTSREWRARQLPTFVAVESPRRSAKQSPKIRI